MRIYIAGALSSKEKRGRDPSTIVVDYLQNVHKMVKAAAEVRKKGHFPYVPGLDFVPGIVSGNFTESDYRGMGMEFLKVCDAILVISDSWGVQKELKVAKELGLSVFRSINDIPAVQEA